MKENEKDNIGKTILTSMAKIEVTYLKCNRCEHKWIPRRPETPKVCPSCNSPYWDKVRVRPVGEKKNE